MRPRGPEAYRRAAGVKALATDLFSKPKNHLPAPAASTETQHLLHELLPVMDNFERALACNPHSDDPVLVGVRLVAEQLTQVLARHGVHSFSALGKPFDPRLHEALERRACAGATPGTILQELSRGYMLHQQLLRAARVVVASVV